MAGVKERGLLVKLDEGFFMRLDHETLVRSTGVGRAIPRTAVIRSLLRFALDHFAEKRGEDVPSAEPVTAEEMAAVAAALEASNAEKAAEVEAKAEAVEAPQQVEQVIASAPEPPAQVEAKQPGGAAWLGRGVRMIGVKS